MSGECLLALSVSHIPQLQRRNIIFHKLILLSVRYSNFVAGSAWCSIIQRAKDAGQRNEPGTQLAAPLSYVTNPILVLSPMILKKWMRIPAKKNNRLTVFYQIHVYVWYISISDADPGCLSRI